MPASKSQPLYIYFIAVVIVCCVVATLVYLFHIKYGVIRHSFGEYEVVEIKGVLTPQECDDLMAFSQKKNMFPSQVVSPDKGEYSVKENQRKSLSLWLKDTDHIAANKMADTAEYWTNTPRNHQEYLQVVKYDEGGKFNAHYDPQYGSTTQSRKATLLVYLNDDYVGGQTYFVNLGLKIKPEKGKGILFRSLDDSGKIIDVSLHCGEKVERGNKWICTKWIHNMPFSPPSAAQYPQ